MVEAGKIAGFKTFKVGPKNLRLEERSKSPDPAVTPGYDALVESDLPFVQLMEATSIEITPEDQQIAAEILEHADEGKIVKHFDLFEFPKRADYGRDGVDEYFVRDRLAFFGFRPATLVELFCFGRCLRQTYENVWFESKSIIALGSVATTTEVIRKGGWLRKEVAATYRHFPELICVAGRPLDQIKLTTTEKDKHGNWPNEVLFLGTALK
jgi:hypothetical protein